MNLTRWSLFLAVLPAAMMMAGCDTPNSSSTKMTPSSSRTVWEQADVKDTPDRKRGTETDNKRRLKMLDDYRKEGMISSIERDGKGMRLVVGDAFRKADENARLYALLIGYNFAFNLPDRSTKNHPHEIMRVVDTSGREIGVMAEDWKPSK